MKEEAVAWMSPDGKVSKTEGKLFYIPLYTAPQTKPLSDEEIDKIIKNCGYEIEETIMGKFVDIEGINMYNSFRGFARAIEERHGIK